MAVSAVSAYKRALKKYQDTITTAKLSARERVSILKESKYLKRKQRRWRLKSGIKRMMNLQLDSSFVGYMSYDNQSNNVDVLLSGIKYRYFNVPEAIFNAWTKGAATCMTSDSGKRKQWWIGKTPSLGAFFNHYIKNKYTWVRM